jgi:hypothetical protein
MQLCAGTKSVAGAGAKYSVPAVANPRRRRADSSLSHALLNHQSNLQIKLKESDYP